MVYNITDQETQPTVWNHLNGSSDEILDRYCVSELCKGWPVYRDASEWRNFRDLFADKGAFVFTTWSGGLPIDDFIEVSKKGRAAGDFIMHRENGTLVDLNPVTNRAVGKMKVTITQRFSVPNPSSSNINGINGDNTNTEANTTTFDVECDCRFIFFCKKTISGSAPDHRAEWKIQYNKNFYEKDRLVPVDGRGDSIPLFSQRELEKFPEGYRYLGLAQEKYGGHAVVRDLPTMRDDEAFRGLTRATEMWLRAERVGEVLGIPGEVGVEF
ncbi:accessory factor associated with RNA polymerase II [Paecilomyces lecythidis]